MAVQGQALGCMLFVLHRQYSWKHFNWANSIFQVHEAPMNKNVPVSSEPFFFGVVVELLYAPFLNMVYLLLGKMFK